jgi:putative endopeptidase
MKIETALAKASLDITSRRNPTLLVHSMTKQQLDALSPQFSFTRYFTSLGAPPFEKMNVAVPDFIKGLNQVLAQERLDNLKDYLVWHYTSTSATKLPHAFVEATFDFYSKTLSGVEADRPRWKRCVAGVDQELGEALGKRFVEKTFGEQGKARTLQMVDQIEKEMGKDIDSLSWLSAKTKEAAHEKLKMVTNKIGYPDKFRDYSSVTVKADDYFGNFYRANEFEWNRQLAKVGKPVDRKEWIMTPPTVNAYYNPTENNINFPAGILQSPFYSNAASDSVNIGAIGVVVGHELTHGFDDQGRQFDGEGNLRDWWTKEDAKEFDRLAQCFVNQYGGFSPVKGVELNGKLTLGENAADNGGARLAYAALMADLATRTGATEQKLDDYTPAQQFFLGFAQVWCENVRPEAERMQAQTDPHSPGKYRVTGVVQNMSEFGAAFGCKAPSPMQSAKSCRVW